MKFERWNKTKLEEIVEINPRTSLKKGTVAKKVAMEHVKEFTRKISGFEVTEFKSGSKFINNDTLMARITPCLENGKTAYVDILEDDEVAFGSTEFFVLRSKEGKSDSKFIYYLSISEEFRKVAIQSMTGTSGRQRAQKDSLLNYELSVPSLKEQKKIGEILSLYDEKVESNNAIISNLEELAQTLFKHWFVDFEFPNEEGKPYKSSGGKMVESELGRIPKGWSIGTLSDIAQVVMGQSPKSSTYNEELVGIPLINGASDFKKDKIEPLKYTTDPKRLSQKGDYLFGVRATVGNVTYVDREYALGRGVGIARVKDKKYGEYLYFHLINGINRLKYSATGSVYINFKRNDLMNMKLVMCDQEIVEKFHKSTISIFKEKHNLLKQNKTLEILRDTLLPKLLSGEIELPDDMEVTDDVPVS